MLPVFVNLFAAVQYVSQCNSRVRIMLTQLKNEQWCRVCLHANGGVGVVDIDQYKYFDYVFTCPLLVLQTRP